MARVRYGPASRRRRKRVSRLAKGQRGGRSRWHRITMESVKKALAYSTRDRRARKREFRRLWILRISKACRENGLSYTTFMKSLKESGVALNRKMLADIAVNDRASFKRLVEEVSKK